MKTKGVARSFVIERLPRWFAKRVVGDPEILSESYVDERHRRVFADVVLRVRLRGGGSLILYCLLEHKRVEERFALVQLLQYMTAIYEQQARSGVELLAPVVPIIVYNGKRAWQGPLRFRDLLVGEVSDALAPYVLDFEVILVDLGREPIESLSQNRMLRGGLLGLKAAAVPSARFDGVLREMLRSLAGEASTQRFFLSYLLKVVGPEVLSSIDRVAKELGEKTMQTAEEYLIAKGFRRGRRAARAERAAGLAEGIRLSLSRALKVRFGRLPKTATTRIANASPKTLTSWVERAVTAEKLSEVFATN